MKMTKKGFTLIEVILVLAIAAMIFLMVLLTLPAVQRSQRDLSRRDAVGAVIAAHTEFVGNNRGQAPLPERNQGLAENGGCMGSPEASDVCSLNPYVRLQDAITFRIHSQDFGAQQNVRQMADDVAPNQDRIVVFPRAQCGESGVVVRGTSRRQIAVVIGLEGAGNDGESLYFCQDS